MRKKLPAVLVTGGAGFIGSEFVRRGVEYGYRIIVIDKLTYAGDIERLGKSAGKAVFHKLDIRSRAGMERVFRDESPGIVVNLRRRRMWTGAYGIPRRS